jgi:hypothetical protein
VGHQPILPPFLRQVIQIDEARIRDHLGEMVRGTVEETLNAMLDAKADQLCGAGRYERSQARQDTRAGSYERTLQTSAGGVNLKVPKLRRQTLQKATTAATKRHGPTACSRHADKRTAAPLKADDDRQAFVFGGGVLSLAKSRAQSIA